MRPLAALALALLAALLWPADNTARADAPPTLRALEPWLALEATIVKTTTLRYNAYDAAGEAATPGSYAFLTDTDGATSAVAAYEDLRNGTTKRLLIHKADAQGVSQAPLYDAIATGDFFEWRKADDCWVRYRVTEVRPNPPGGAAPRKLLAVEWTTYAFTGCTGAITPDAAAAFDWDPLPNLGGPSLTAPIRHGPFQIVPEDWEGQVEQDPFRPWPGNSYANPVGTTELAEARQLPHWRDPTLPAAGHSRSLAVAICPTILPTVTAPGGQTTAATAGSKSAEASTRRRTIRESRPEATASSPWRPG